ncbi:hypothetical protein SKAU_G00383670 [Synaphobranchus kaupii]|uniref:PLA2c domain-containing protein n=1 Tax=Synaphobranchus kaupii TaxID=118154 RepID=A0A9Q1EE34_SYNKA|nr:hypothetical protein SKAU_G00383670 [Synaphobranchus kaupii]
MVRVEKCLKDNGIQSNNVPHIAVLGSGGGERAMIGLLGCIDQLYEANLLDTCWFELSPHEVGYSHIGAFVDTSSSRSKFEDGVLKQKTAEKDMLYLQDTLDDKATKMAESLLQLFDCKDDEEGHKLLEKIHCVQYHVMSAVGGGGISTISRHCEACTDMKTEVLVDWFEIALQHACDAYSKLKDVLDTLSDVIKIIVKTMPLLNWTWGTTNNFLYNCPLNDAEVPEEVLSNKRTRLEDAGLVMNSPYVAALRPDRKVKLILSFDFSAGDPFMTVTQAAEHCKKTGIPFPPVEISEEDTEQPKDFYVFKSENTPTVIHIPLFNMVNCEACWFELSPHEVGYSHIGAFVGTSSSRSKFEVGVLKQKTAEKDMLYLQGYSSSGCLADTDTDEEEGDTLDDMATEMAESLLQLFDCEDDEEGHKLLEKMHRVRYHIILDAEVPEEVLSKERTHLEDAGLVMNSPYVAALRPDRKVKLILSFDFSAGDPFMTVTQAAEQCKQTGIPFPPVEISKEDTEQPKDLYVFKSENTPTVIHIPLFNMVNCEGDVAKWSQKYKTFRFAYDRETLDDLIRVSGLNVANNKKRILREISVCK